MKDIYLNWYSQYSSLISKHIFKALLDQNGYKLLWMPRGYGNQNSEYYKRLRACYAETAILASQILEEIDGSV